MKRMLTYVLLAAIACGRGQDLGNRIDYDVQETYSASRGPGGCFWGPSGDLASARGTSWAPGAMVHVVAWWPQRNDCQMISCHSESCESVTVQVRATNPAVWKVEQSSGERFSLLAVGEGEGGVHVTANGRVYEPPLTLKVSVGASEIWAERVLGWDGGWRTERLSELRLTRGQTISVVLTLRDSAGLHICGDLEMNLTVEPAALLSTIQSAYGEARHVNTTYTIIAGTVPGRGMMRGNVGAIQLSLPIAVE